MIKRKSRSRNECFCSGCGWEYIHRFAITHLLKALLRQGPEPQNLPNYGHPLQNIFGGCGEHMVIGPNFLAATEFLDVHNLLG